MGPLRLRAAPAATALALALGGCGGEEQAQEPAAPVEGLAATLADEVEDRGAGRIAWSTTWRLCWGPAERAVAYELQALTGEGASPELARTEERCFELEAAAGENAKAAGLEHRDELLALAAGQLGYRVRAVLADGRRTPWSRSVAVGETTAPGTP